MTDNHAAVYTLYLTRSFTAGLTTMNWHSPQAVKNRVDHLIDDNPHIPPRIYLKALTTALATALTAIHGTVAEEPVRAALQAAGNR